MRKHSWYSGYPSGIRGAAGGYPLRALSPGVPLPALFLSGYPGGYPAVPPQLFLFRVSGEVPMRYPPSFTFPGIRGGTHAGVESAGTPPPAASSSGVHIIRRPLLHPGHSSWGSRGAHSVVFGPMVLAFWVFRHLGQRLISVVSRTCSRLPGPTLEAAFGYLR